MSLDQNLFTLVVTPHPENPNVIDLVDQVKGATIYRKQRVPGPSYSMEFYDFNSESLLATATAPSQSSKTKTIELQNPTVPVELKYTGTLSFKWGFKWEDHDFEWRREECYMLRKPDPAVLVAITKEPSGKLKTSVIQLLDYNLNRFDIDDRKGLEVVMLTALMTLNDSNQDYHEGGSGLSLPRRKSATAAAARPAVLSDSPPPPVPSKPPLPAAKTGIDRIAELQALRSEPNEVNVEDEGTVDAYAEYCYNLLLDDAMLFITVSSVEASHVPKVLQVVEATKRLRYKNGEDEEPLHQYVLYDQQKKKGPKRINLDTQKGSKAYEPPSSLSVHLSKIEMDELKPKQQ
ncbi:hypothetical protein DL96DRAFT_1583341 [Flagelloscypha sp. PMI_526]|nr:hypothetical protein DL96DRAFT_1583341 [Flagelloscypha sp. PMI_526]